MHSGARPAPGLAERLLPFFGAIPGLHLSYSINGQSHSETCGRPMVTVGRSGLCGCVGALVLKRLCWRHHRVLRWQRIQRGNCNDIW